LDNIRRKAPAQRKAPPADDAFPASQQIVVLSESLAATQHQIQALQEQYFELEKTNKLLVSEVLSLQKIARAQSQASNELITHLNNVEDRRRNSRHSAQSSHSGQPGQNFHTGAMGFLPDGADEPAPELRRAREILNGVSPDVQADRELERLSMAYNQNGSPADSAGSSSAMFAQPGPSMSLVDSLNDPRHMVYPVGQTTGIDPFHADHIHNIPYSRPLSNPNIQAEAPSQITPPLKEQLGSMWRGKKPHILLVEDDKTCARIGSKFLTNMGCTVDSAVSKGERAESGTWLTCLVARRPPRRRPRQPRRRAVRSHLHGHHYAQPRRRVGHSYDPSGRPARPYRGYDVEYSAGRYRDLLPVR
jgi:osomolarity two-component system response regulator SKN7